MKRLAVLAALLALMAAACGGDDGGAGTSATRTVQIEMRDIAFSPDSLSVKKGETVRFVFTNKGKVDHDAFIGDEAAQADHEKAARAGGGEHGGGHGGGGGGLTVGPGKTAELEETFDEAGTTFIGCHEPGHYDAGMKIAVTVT